MNTTTAAQDQVHVSSARLAGRVVRGVMIGMLLVPAVCGLIAFVGNITAFAYQGY